MDGAVFLKELEVIHKEQAKAARNIREAIIKGNQSKFVAHTEKYTKLTNRLVEINEEFSKEMRRMT